MSSKSGTIIDPKLLKNAKVGDEIDINYSQGTKQRGKIIAINPEKGSITFVFID